MQSIAVQPVATRSARAMLVALAVAFALAFAAVGPAAAVTAPGGAAGAAADAPAALKAVIIVGPTHNSTTSYLARGESLAKVAESYGMDVRRVFHPRATPERVLQHIQGAHMVAYFGHGNGWPSPYAPFQERSKNGFGLNPVEGGSQNTVEYKGGNWIRSNITLAPNAVVLFNGLCYAEGNGESGMAIPTWTVAHERVDNFAAAFLHVGARAVFAYGWQSVNSIVDMLFTTNKTMDEIFMTKGGTSSPSSGFIGWNNKRLDSVRMPGFKNHLDPHSKEGFLRALSGNLAMTASEWSGSDPSGGVTPPDVGPSVPTGLAATTDSTGSVYLSWDASTANMIGAIKYRVFRNGSAIGSLQTALTYTDKPSKSGTYGYQVRAVDPAGNKSDLSTPAVSVSVTVPAASPSPTPTASPSSSPSPTPSPSPSTSPSPSLTGPSVPQGLTGKAEDNYVIKLSWQPSVSTASGTVKYRVFRNGMAIGTKQSATSFTDQRSKANTFKYQVRAIDAAGNKSALSPAITVSSVLTVGSSGSSDVGGPDTTPPSVPAGLSTEALGYRYVKVSWQPSTDDRAGTIEYRLFRNDRRVATLKGDTTFTDRPKNPGTHSYKVRAIDAAGNKSAFSPVKTGQAVTGPI